MNLSGKAKAGAAIFAGTVQFSFVVVLSEIIYSAYGAGGYSSSSNAISDLGANCQLSGACYIPPSAILFDASALVLGALLVVGAYCLRGEALGRSGAVAIALTGFGALGVGLFPETTGIWHGIFSLVAFLFGGLAAILCYRIQKWPLSVFSCALGIVTLVALSLYATGTDLGLGAGGMERVVVYPVLLWGVAFGGHLLASGAQ